MINIVMLDQEDMKKLNHGEAVSVRMRGNIHEGEYLLIQHKTTEEAQLMTTTIYLCDRKRCGEKCSYPTCKHTSDTEHAVNFEKQVLDNEACYVEKEKTIDDN